MNASTETQPTPTLAADAAPADAAPGKGAPADSVSTDSESTEPPPLPDRLSVDPRSPHFVKVVLEREIGIRFNGKDRLNVEEYCISEGWIKVAAGKTLDRKGRPFLIKLHGEVEPFYR